MKKIFILILFFVGCSNSDTLIWNEPLVECIKACQASGGQMRKFYKDPIEPNTWQCKCEWPKEKK